MPAQQRRIWLILHALQFFVLSNIFCHASELEKLMCEVYTIFYDIWCSTIRKSRNILSREEVNLKCFEDWRSINYFRKSVIYFRYLVRYFKTGLILHFLFLKSLRIMCIKVFSQVFVSILSIVIIWQMFIDLKKYKNIFINITQH